MSPPPTGPMAELHWQVNALVQGGQYRYKEELQQWEACVPLGPEPKTSIEVSTPLQADTCASLLAAHPEQWFAQFIVQGIRQDFRIGFDRSKGASPRPLKGNMSIPQPELVTVPGERGEPGKDGDYCEVELGPHQPNKLDPQEGKARSMAPHSSFVFPRWGKRQRQDRPEPGFPQVSHSRPPCHVSPAGR